MVLHHLAAPAEALQQLARRVAPGGSLVTAALGASVWRVEVEVGQQVSEADALVVL